MEEWLEIENEVRTQGHSRAQRIRVHRVRNGARPPIVPDQRPLRLPAPGTGRPRGLVYERLFAPPGCLLRVPRRHVFQPADGAEPDSGGATVDVLVQVYGILRPVEVARVARLEGLETDALRVLSRPAARALDLAIPPASLPVDPDPETPRLAPRGATLVALSVVHEPPPPADRPEGSSGMDSAAGTGPPVEGETTLGEGDPGSSPSGPSLG